MSKIPMSSDFLGVSGCTKKLNQLCIILYRLNGQNMAKY